VKDCRIPTETMKYFAVLLFAIGKVTCLEQKILYVCLASEDFLLFHFTFDDCNGTIL